MGDQIRLPAIPAISPRIDREVANALRALKLHAEATAQGYTALSRKVSGGEGDDAPPLPPELVDKTPPPYPTGVKATGAFAVIIVEWDAPVYSNHSHAEIWRSDTQNISKAVLIGQSPGFTFADAVGNARTCFYWVRFVSRAGIAGAYHSANGVSGSTSPNPGYLLDILTGQITEGQLWPSLGDRIDLIDAPANVAGSVSAKVAKEALDRANAIAAEILARKEADDALARDISSLAVGASMGFDAAVGDYFENGSVDGWTGHGMTLSSVSGWLVQSGTQDANAYLQKTGLSIAGGKYPAIRASVKRKSGTTMKFKVDFQAGGVWHSGLQAAAVEIPIGTQGVVDVDFGELVAWTGATITGLRIYPSAAAADEFAFFYIAIGRYAPGASQAALTEEKLARIAGDEAEAAARLVLQASVDENAAAIVRESQASVDRDSAISRDVQTLAAKTTTDKAELSAALEEERIARTTADSAMAAKVDQAVASVELGQADAQEQADKLVEATLNNALSANKGNDEQRASDAALAVARQEIRANATAIEAEATHRLELAAKVNENTGLIVSESTARATEDAALGKRIDTVVAQTGENKAAIQSEVEARTTADSAISKRIDTVQSSVAGNTASIQTQATSIDGLKAQYSVKIDNNGFVSGFGLSSSPAEDGTPFSEFIFRADRFAIGAPEKPNGQSKYVPFVVQVTASEINGVAVPPGVYMDAAFIANGSIGNAQIGMLAVDTAKIADLTVTEAKIDNLAVTSAKIKDLTADKITTGTLRAGVEITAGSRLKISAEGWIESYSGGGFNRAMDYVRLDSGNVTSYKYVPAEAKTHPYAMLTRTESGVAKNGEEVILPGYWTSQPRIYVAPANLCCYDARYSNQSQTLELSATDVAETGTGTKKWKFKPTARLVLAAASVQAVINWSTTSSSNTVSSLAHTSPGNVKKITATVAAGSTRGTGTAPNYYNRAVRWRIKAGDRYSSWRTIGLAGSFGEKTDTATLDVPAGNYAVSIEYDAIDSGGTFSSGAEWEYSQLTSYAADIQFQRVLPGWSRKHEYGQTLPGTTASLLAQFGGVSVPSGWGIYEVELDYRFDVTCRSCYGGFGLPFFHSLVGFSDWAGQASGVAPPSQETGSATNIKQNVQRKQRYASTSFSPPMTININAGQGQYFNPSAGGTYLYSDEVSIGFKALTATIFIRRKLTNSTTPSNTFRLSHFDYELANAAVLAEGSLNYVAVGD